MWGAGELPLSLCFVSNKSIVLLLVICCGTELSDTSKGESNDALQQRKSVTPQTNMLPKTPCIYGFKRNSSLGCPHLDVCLRRGFPRQTSGFPFGFPKHQRGAPQMIWSWLPGFPASSFVLTFWLKPFVMARFWSPRKALGTLPFPF